MTEAPGEMPIFNPDPVDEGIVIERTPDEPMPPPTLTPLTPQQYEQLTGLPAPTFDPADVNHDGHVSRAEDEFANGSYEPFEQRDSSHGR